MGEIGFLNRFLSASRNNRLGCPTLVRTCGGRRWDCSPHNSPHCAGSPPGGGHRQRSRNVWSSLASWAGAVAKASLAHILHTLLLRHLLLTLPCCHLTLLPPGQVAQLTWSCEPVMYLMHCVGFSNPKCTPMAVRSLGRSHPSAQSPPPWWPRPSARCCWMMSKYPRSKKGRGRQGKDGEVRVSTGDGMPRW